VTAYADRVLAPIFREVSPMRIVTAARVSAALVLAWLLFGCAGYTHNNAPSGVGLNSTLLPQQLETPVSLMNPANLGKIRKAGQPRPTWMRLRALDSQADSEVGTASVPILYGPPPQFPGKPLIFAYTLSNVKHNAGWICEYFGPQTQYLIGVDFSNNLWIPQKVSGTGQLLTNELPPVTNSCNIDSILQIPDTDGQPGAVAFDRKGGVYIENVVNTNGPGAGASVDVYAAGQTTPSTVLQEPNAYMAVDVAVDAQRNVYMSWIDSSKVGHVDEFGGGQNPPITLPMTTGFIGGITFDADANLLVVDQTSGKIDVFSKPYGKTPLATIQLGSFSLQCTFNHHRDHLYCGDYAQGSIDIYKYNSLNPGLTVYKYSWTNGLDPAEMVQGVALAPPAPN
jgi:hypothetical protein